MTEVFGIYANFAQGGIVMKKTGLLEIIGDLAIIAMATANIFLFLLIFNLGPLWVGENNPLILLIEIAGSLLLCMIGLNRFFADWGSANPYELKQNN